MILTVTLEGYVKKFREAVERGVNAIEEAAQVYAAALDEHPAAASEFAARCPGIPATAWAGFEAVGRGWVDKRLLWGGGAAQRALKYLPISMQRQALDGGVELLIGSGESLIVNVDNLTADQCRQVFAKDRIRDLGAQRAWVESRNPPASITPRPAAPFEIVGNGSRRCVRINEPCELQKKDLARLLMDLED